MKNESMHLEGNSLQTMRMAMPAIESLDTRNLLATKPDVDAIDVSAITELGMAK